MFSQQNRKTNQLQNSKFKKETTFSVVNGFTQGRHSLFKRNGYVQKNNETGWGGGIPNSTNILGGGGCIPNSTNIRHNPPIHHYVLCRLPSPLQTTTTRCQQLPWLFRHFIPVMSLHNPRYRINLVRTQLILLCSDWIYSPSLNA
jgi:hypothetical protein